MSKEPRRVAFTTVGQSGSSLTSSVTAVNETASSFSPSISRFGGGEFLTPDVPGSTTGKSGSSKNTNKTLRLQLELFASDTSKYPEFNYSKLLYLEKKKEKKLKQVSTTTNGFGSDPFAENDDDVARIAKELEAKYGSTYVTGRGRSKKKDIGLGYDETDSFIDNTDAYDEVIPEEVETIEGGFYINCGALEFSNLNKKSNTSRTDEIIKMPDRPKKRALSTSSEESSSSESDDDDDDDDEEEEEEEEEAEAEDDSESENDVVANDDENTSNKNDSDKSSSTKKKSPKHEEKRIKHGNESSSKSKSVHVSKNGSKKQNKKAKFLTSGSSSNSPRPNAMETNSDTDDRHKSQKVVVKTTTVKDMLKAKRDNFLKSQEACGEGAVKSINGEVKCTSSDDDSCSGSSATETEVEQEILPETKSKKPENAEKLRTTDTKLPISLDAEVIANINNFKELTNSKNLMGKKFLFDQKLTELLLKIDEALLCIDKNERNMVFAHMEFQLQLPKYFFLRKAKQLRIKEEKAKTGRALGKLRKAVIELMPKCIATYETELCKFADMQANIINAEHPPKMPRKKFPWNSDIRNLLYEVYQVRWTSYAVLGTRKETLKEFINDYLKSKVVEIWPNGWIRYEELQKEIEKRKNATKKVKEKVKKDSKSGTTTTTTITTSNTAIITQGTEVIQATTSTSSSNVVYLKKYEEYSNSASIGRSYANSDTDSVASVSSNERVKQTKNKTPRNQQAQPIASTSAAAAAAMAMPIVSTSGALDLVSSSRKTDHSIYNIISAMAAAPSTSAAVTMTTVASKQTNIHSNATSRPAAHVINLDDYKCPSDILQTSKQLASAILTTTAKVSDIPINFTNINANSSGRNESGSESDSVEIIGVFPANQLTTTTTNSPNTHSGSSSKQKYNKKAFADSVGKQFSNASSGPTNIAMEQLLPMNNNNNGNGNSNITFSAKDFERLKQIRHQQFLSLAQSKIKGSPANE